MEKTAIFSFAVTLSKKIFQTKSEVETHPGKTLGRTNTDS